MLGKNGLGNTRDQPPGNPGKTGESTPRLRHAPIGRLPGLGAEETDREVQKLAEAMPLQSTEDEQCSAPMSGWLPFGACGSLVGWLGGWLAESYFGACCQGMLGFQLFAKKSERVFRIKPLKVSHS